MSDNQAILKFSIKAHSIPLYINGKLLAARIIPLHQMDEKLFNKIDDRGKGTLQEFFYSRYGIHCEPEEKRLSAEDFLKKKHFVAHAILISYDKIALVMGYNIFHHRFTNTNPRAGVHIDYFTSVPLNYPNNIRLKYFGNFQTDDTFYRVRGVGHATIALACCYALSLHPKEANTTIAVDLTARSDESLINDRYIKTYGFEFYKGKRGKDNELYLNFNKAKNFLKAYEDEYKTLERPEGNGLAYHDPMKH